MTELEKLKLLYDALDKVGDAVASLRVAEDSIHDCLDEIETRVSEGTIRDMRQRRLTN